MSRNSAILFIFTILILASSTTAFAQTPTVIQEQKEKIIEQRQAVKERVIEQKEVRKENLLEKKSAIRERVEDKKEALQERKDERKEAFKERRETLKEKREELKETIQQKREEAKEQFKAKREAFKEKLETIKDERKKAVIEKVDEKLQTVNTNRTNHMSEVLEKFSSILDKIIDKTEQAKINGKDTSNVEVAITDAQTTLSNSQSAVATQAGKEYIATITNETTVKTNVSNAFNQLKADLQITHQSIITARQKIAQAAAELAKTRGANTETVTVTPVVTQ